MDLRRTAGETDAGQAVSETTYADAAEKADAVDVVKTLELPNESGEAGQGRRDADVSVVLGQDDKAGGSVRPVGRSDEVSRGAGARGDGTGHCQDGSEATLEGPPGLTEG